MLNLAAAELVTTSITGEPIHGEVVEIIDFTTDRDGMSVDVRLADGRVFEDMDALDINPRLNRQLAATAA